MISTHIWIITLGGLATILLFDLILAVARRNKQTSMLEASFWTIFYVGAALLFGLLLPNWTNEQAQTEFFAGWLTEYALSVDNIFIFIIILGHLNVRRERQQLVLLLGIMLSIAMRGALIPIGATVISRFTSVFFLFGSFLIYTAWQLAKHSNDESKWEEGRIVKKMRAKGMSTTAIALVALGITDLVFSLDSIPAIFGLTKNPYIVITANAFALMGLRQLYFLLGGLMKRLVYLSKGLSVILGFIGVKMILEAFHGIGMHNAFGFRIPEVSLEFSLGTIVTILIVTTVASLTASRGIAGAE